MRLETVVEKRACMWGVAVVVVEGVIMTSTRRYNSKVLRAPSETPAKPVLVPLPRDCSSVGRGPRFLSATAEEPSRTPYLRPSDPGTRLGTKVTTVMFVQERVEGAHVEAEDPVNEVAVVKAVK